MARCLAVLSLAFATCSHSLVISKRVATIPQHRSRPVLTVAVAPAEATTVEMQPASAPEREAIVYFRDHDDAHYERLSGKPPVDEELVNSLVAKRSLLRAQRRYDEADVVKAAVVAMGVTIVDMRGREAWYVTPRHSRYVDDQPEISQAEATKKPWRDLGPRGHDYSRTGGGAKGKAGQVSLGKIDDLLAARLMAKLRANFELADAKRDELESLGVIVCDETKQWRADGLPFESALAAAKEAAAAADEYVRGPGDGDADAPDLDTSLIMSLLTARLTAKRRRDFARADAITATMRAEHSVVVDDRRKAWRVVRLYGEYHRVGGKVGKAEPKIGALLTKLTACRQPWWSEEPGAAEAEADSILSELAAMGVQVDERSKTWKRPRRTNEEMAAAKAAGPHSRSSAMANVERQGSVS